MTKHLPAVFLMCSLMSSIILCTISNRKIATAWYRIMALISLVCSLFLSRLPDITYSFGNWTGGIGVDIVFNQLASLFIIMASIVFFITSGSIAKSSAVKTGTLGFCGLIFTGITGLILTADLFSLYVFLELTSIALYVALATGYKGQESYLSSFNYLIIGSVANIIILLGIFFIYSATGSLNMEAISKIVNLQARPANIKIITEAGYVLILVGLLAKSGLYPMHGWIARCYIDTPPAIISFVAGIVTKISIFNIYKINNMFGHHFIASKLYYCIPVVDTMCYLSIILCSLMALSGYSIKKVLVFSSMSQSGYFLLGVFSFQESIISGALLQMLAHSIAVAMLFVVMDFAEKKSNYQTELNISNMQTYLRGENLLRFAFVLSVCNVIGFPMTLGFTAKWHMLSGFYESRQYLSFAIIVLGSGIGMFYGWRLVEYMFFQKRTIENKDEAQIGFAKTPRRWTKVLFVSVVFSILLGIFNQPAILMAERAIKPIIEPNQRTVASSAPH